MAATVAKPALWVTAKTAPALPKTKKNKFLPPPGACELPLWRHRQGRAAPGDPPNIPVDPKGMDFQANPVKSKAEEEGEAAAATTVVAAVLSVPATPPAH
jgi:hypothetical protein